MPGAALIIFRSRKALLVYFLLAFVMVNSVMYITYGMPRPSIPWLDEYVREGDVNEASMTASARYFSEIGKNFLWSAPLLGLLVYERVASEALSDLTQTALDKADEAELDAKRAKEASAAKTRFLSVMSHELR